MFKKCSNFAAEIDGAEIDAAEIDATESMQRKSMQRKSNNSTRRKDNKIVKVWRLRRAYWLDGTDG